GDIVELRGWLDPESRPGMEGANRKVKGTIHWVSAPHAVAAEIRLYDRLFSVPDPDDESGGQTYRDHINPDSLLNVRGYVERASASCTADMMLVCDMLGLCATASHEQGPEQQVSNRSVSLRDTRAAKA